MPKIHDLTGKVFNRLTALRFVGRRGNVRMWLCRCECGNELPIRAGNLVSGHSKSCGCLNLEKASIRPVDTLATEKGRRSPETIAYRSARNRCENPRNRDYPRYGGRGVEFRFATFAEFLQALGRRPSDIHSVDRYPDNNGHYEPGNVRWATPTEQSRNRRSQHWLTMDGETKTIAEWSSIVGLDQSCIKNRKGFGWCDVCSLTISSGAGRCIHLPPKKQTPCCSEPGCGREHRSNGYCSSHLSKWQRSKRKEAAAVRKLIEESK